MRKIFTPHICAAFLVLSGAAVQAATVQVTVDTFAKTDLADARAAYDAYTANLGQEVVEDFESFDPISTSPEGIANPVETNVGEFLGVSSENGSGGSAVNGGVALEIRDEVPMYGRANTTVGGANWLDSNDLQSMVWTTGGALTSFNSLVFFLTDVGDIAGTDFLMSVDGAGFDEVTTKIDPQPNGTIHVVQILFDELVSDITTTFSSKLNDGFGIDDVSIGVAPVPLPPAGLLLVAGIAGLAVRGHRRSKASA